MKKLAIISSYNENCGNASYTHNLKQEFQKYVEVDVIPLDLFLLQKATPLFKQAGDQHIQEIAQKLKKYDFVNIQFEAGLYGASDTSILKRIKELMDASQSVILTMHRIDIPEYTKTDYLRAILRGSLYDLKYMRSRNHASNLYTKIIDYCKERSKVKNTWIAVHTKRESRILQTLFDFKNHFDFPLTYLNREERQKIISYSHSDDFKKKHKLPVEKRIVGLFGYISDYKGVETAIKSLGVLPDDYMLAIFGTQHPQAIKAQTKVDPYINILLEEIMANGRSISISPKGRNNNIKHLGREIAESLHEAHSSHRLPSNLVDRVRFIGNLNDDDFMEALRLCDAVVLPYMEVGQSMSGVVALATETGARLFCTTNLSFNEVKKYYGNAYNTFDIGNYIELAQKILYDDQDYSAQREKIFDKYNIEKNIQLHMNAFNNSFSKE